MINYLNSLRDKKQIIFVTHNPLLVVNLDVDNVIIMSNHNSKIQCKCGCLEDEEILENVALLLDGGKETIEKRLKLYGRKKLKITIDNYSNILIFVNTQLKITIDEKTNQITGKQIYDAIQLNSLDKVSIDELD